VAAAAVEADTEAGASEAGCIGWPGWWLVMATGCQKARTRACPIQQRVITSAI